MPSWSSVIKPFAGKTCVAGLLALAAAMAFIPPPPRLAAQTSQPKRYYLVDGAGSRLMVLTVFPDDTETLELVNSKGQGFARFSDRAGTPELDLLAPGKHTGIFVTFNHTFGITAALSAGRKLTIPVPQSQGTAAAQQHMKTEYNFQKCSQRAADLKDETVAVEGPDGRGVALWEHDVTTDSVDLLLFDPQGYSWGIAGTDITQEKAYPSWGNYGLTLDGDTIDCAFTAKYHLHANWRAEPPTVSMDLRLPHGTGSNGFYEINPRTMALSHYVPNGLSFLWLNLPDAFPGLPLRVQDEVGKTKLSTAVKKGPDALFILAERSYFEGQYETARRRFTEYLANHPAGEQAAAAQLLIGQCYKGEGSWAKEIVELNTYLTRYPNDFHVPMAMLDLAYAQIKEGKRQAAIGEFRSLVERYPKSTEARVARSDLKALLAGGRHN